jgi:hypothetical protein
MAVKVSLEMLQNPCALGAEEAHRLFKPGLKYTFAEMVEAGASDHNLAWLLSRVARMNSAAMPLLIGWAKALADDCGLRCRPPRTIEECQATVSASMKHWARNRPTSKGARQWAFAKLREILRDAK